MKISTVIITFNEERNIAECIDSLHDVAEEIIVVDSFSTDQTEIICREKKVKFIQRKFEGHIEQKNFAAALAENNWVLSLDADERLSVELRNSILQIRNENAADAFQMNRLNNYCGQWIKHGVWYPDKKIRLWKKEKGKWGGTNPHDRVLMSPESKIAWLPGELLHFTARTKEEYLLQQKKFGTIANKERRKGGKKNFIPTTLRSAFAFTRSYILRLGFLDGNVGFEIAKGYAVYTQLKYSNLK